MNETANAFVLNELSERPKLIEKEVSGIAGQRLFVKKIKKTVFESGLRIIILSGLRGSGKTTGLYQFFMETQIDKAFFSCDELASRSIKLHEAVEALDFINKQKIGFEKPFLLFLDEVTYLEKWDLSLKVLSDKRLKLFILATSSSCLPFKKSTELARRAFEIQAMPLSFREFLLLKHDINIPDELAKKIRENIGKKSLEQEYLQVLSRIGSFDLLALYNDYVFHDLPASLKLSDDAYAQAVETMVKRVVYEDFSKYEKFEAKMLSSAETLIKYLSTIPADGVKISKLSEVVGISKESVSRLLAAFENAALIKGVEYKGRNRMYKKPRKWFFYSHSMRFILAAPVSNKAEIIGNAREDSVFRHLQEISKNVFYSHECDFITDEWNIEVGKNKKPRPGTIIVDASQKISLNTVPIPLLALAV
mgnify:CR=1 FL=1